MALNQFIIDGYKMRNRSDEVKGGGREEMDEGYIDEGAAGGRRAEVEDVVDVVDLLLQRFELDETLRHRRTRTATVVQQIFQRLLRGRSCIRHRQSVNPLIH